MFFCIISSKIGYLILLILKCSEKCALNQKTSRLVDVKCIFHKIELKLNRNCDFEKLPKIGNPELRGKNSDFFLT